MRILASGSPPPLPGLLNSLAGPLDHFGYWAVLLLVMLEDFGWRRFLVFNALGAALWAGSWVGLVTWRAATSARSITTSRSTPFTC